MKGSRRRGWETVGMNADDALGSHQNIRKVWTRMWNRKLNFPSCHRSRMIYEVTFPHITFIKQSHSDSLATFTSSAFSTQMHSPKINQSKSERLLVPQCWYQRVQNFVTNRGLYNLCAKFSSSWIISHDRTRSFNFKMRFSRVFTCLESLGGDLNTILNFEFNSITNRILIRIADAASTWQAYGVKVADQWWLTQVG